MRRGVAALLVVAVLLGGCTSDPGDQGATEHAPALSARLERSRLFELERRLKLVLEDEGPGPLLVTRLQLVSPWFEAVPAQDRTSELEPGDPVSIPIAFGEAICEQDAATDAPSTVRLTVDGELHTYPLAEHPADALAALNAQECEAARLLAAADLGFGAQVEGAGAFALTTTLELDQITPGTTVTVDELRSNVVFTVAVGGSTEPPILAVDDDEAHDEVDITLTASRCDSHALTESKKTFTFPAWVHLDGGDAVKVELPVQGELRERLEGFLEQCLRSQPGS